jgi:hypothetical protein
MTKIEAEQELHFINQWMSHKITRRLLDTLSAERVNVLIKVLEIVPEDMREEHLHWISIGEANALDRTRIFSETERDKLIQIIQAHDSTQTVKTEPGLEL